MRSIKPLAVLHINRYVLSKNSCLCKDLILSSKNNESWRGDKQERVCLEGEKRNEVWGLQINKTLICVGV
jgi:hypothetical protein